MRQTAHAFVSPPPRATRERLLDSTVALAEDMRSLPRDDGRGPEGFSGNFQICLPYRGLFIWHVGHDDVVGDANQVLFVSGGEPYRLTQPLPGEYAELIITPGAETLAEIAGTKVARLASHPLFRRRSQRANARLQRLRAQFLQQAGEAEAIDREAAVIELLRIALDTNSNGTAISPRTRRLIARTKMFLEAHLTRPLHLEDIAREVGASPAYLTHAFRVHEGVPLHRYLMQLRLARALVDLPYADDLTRLALDLGFSSHSHFTAAFRRRFECTPSEYRTSTRNHQRRGRPAMTAGASLQMP
jgi:AraC-like DNA-binding protein